MKLLAGLIGAGIVLVVGYIFIYDLPVLVNHLIHSHGPSSHEYTETANDEVIVVVNEATSLGSEKPISKISESIDSNASSILQDERALVGENYVTESLRRVSEDPDYINHLFHQYHTLVDDSDRYFIAQRLTAITVFSELGEHVEKQIVEGALGLQSSGSQSGWSALLGEVGIRSQESRQMLIDAIPTLVDNNVLENVIKAVLPVESPTEENVAVVAHLEQFVEDEDPRIRAVAIRGVSMWGNQDQLSILEGGLNDSSNDVRHAAAGAAMMSDIRSNSIKSSLLRIMSDQSEPLDTQQQAYFSLGNYKLDELELQLIKQWELSQESAVQR